MKTAMRTALLAAALAVAGCNLTYDREGVKFERPSPTLCATKGLEYCVVGVAGTREVCTDWMTDTINCGGCNIVCGVGVQCLSGVCGVGTGTCGAVGVYEQVCGPPDYPVCVDTNTDQRNCGACNIDCGTQSCVSGLCTSAAALTVAPLFPSNGANWNDWVAGTSYVASVDMACDPSGPADCVHAGEFKAVYVTGKTDCAFLSITETLGAFDWYCDGSTNPVRFVTSGLKPGVGLGQLIDSTTPAWRPNGVTVYDGGTAYAASSPAAWWSNPVAAVPAGGNLTSPGTIYVAPATVGGKLTFAASKTALVGWPSGATQLANSAGYTIVTDGVTQRDHLWLEGGFQQASTGGGVQLWQTRFSRIRGLTYARPVSANSDVALYLLQSSRVLVSNLTATGTGFGVYLDGASNNVLDGVVVTDNSNAGVQIENSNANVLTNVTARQTSTATGGQGGAGVGVRLFQAADNVLTGIRVASYGTGIRLEAGGAVAATQRNRLTDVTVAASGGDGLFLGPFTTGNFLRSVRAAENAGNGLTLQGANANTFIDLLTVANGGNGIDATGATDNRFSAVTTSRNQFWGIWFHLGAANNVLASVLSQGNWSGVRFTDATDNLVSDLASTDQLNWLYAEGGSSNRFTGALVVGGVPAGGCVPSASMPGFDAACGPVAPSDFQLTTGVTLAAGASVPGGFVGPTSFMFITDLDDNTTHDWFTFADPYSAWVPRLEPYGRLGCSNAANRTQLSCSGGTWTGDAQVFDWSLMSAPLPTGIYDVLESPELVTMTPAVLTHTWANPPGATTSFVRHAYELPGATGTDDGLCGVGDTCLHTPNLGAFQGVGAPVAVGSFNFPTIGNVNLQRRPVNGY